MIIAVIVFCEIAFWVVILGGLVARYLLRRRRTGAILLALAPVVDLILLIATAVDLMRGASASLPHVLAALYIGFSIAYGHRMVAWADVRFAHRFAQGPAPVKLHGAAYTRACWHDVLRTGLAMGIAGGLLWLLTLIAADTADVTVLTDSYRILALILGIEVLWAISYTVWPRKAPAATAAS